MHYKQSINHEYVLWGSIITSIYKTSSYLLEDKNFFQIQAHACSQKSGQNCIQSHPFIARVARNLPQSNDGQSQHLCPAASCIINKYQAQWIWKSGLFQETYFLTTCFSKCVISFHWEVFTHSQHSDSCSFFFFFLRTRQEATHLSNVLLLSIHFTCQPSVKSLCLFHGPLVLTVL